ncbi:MAG: acylphosphatase [bacterium]
MENKLCRAEITASGLVQGVGFRYFVLQHAKMLNLNGYVKNLYTGEVLTVVEGEKYKIDVLFVKIKTGPSYSRVTKVTIDWEEYKNEFKTFDVRYS